MVALTQGIWTIKRKSILWGKIRKESNTADVCDEGHLQTNWPRRWSHPQRSNRSLPMGGLDLQGPVALCEQSREFLDSVGDTLIMNAKGSVVISTQWLAAHREEMEVNVTTGSRNHQLIEFWNWRKTEKVHCKLICKRIAMLRLQRSYSV